MISKLWGLLWKESATLLWRVFYTLGFLYVVYSIGIAVYRLTLHPLARFPGPFWCRISFLQQCYYEAILKGEFIYEIPKYHERYGKLNIPS
jgi:hypothetical protein